MTYVVIKGFSILIKGMKPNPSQYETFTFQKGTLLKLKENEEYGSVLDFSINGACYEIFLYKNELDVYTAKYISANEIWKELNED